MGHTRSDVVGRARDDQLGRREHRPGTRELPGGVDPRRHVGEQQPDDAGRGGVLAGLPAGEVQVPRQPGDEKRMPSPSRTGSTYTRISSTSARCRHWPATSAPRISRFLPSAASSAVATASPMSPVRIVTFGFGGSSGLWVRRNMGPEKG